jgi:hypothetical protein
VPFPTQEAGFADAVKSHVKVFRNGVKMDYYKKGNGVNIPVDDAYFWTAYNYGDYTWGPRNGGNPKWVAQVVENYDHQDNETDWRVPSTSHPSAPNQYHSKFRGDVGIRRFYGGHPSDKCEAGFAEVHSKWSRVVPSESTVQATAQELMTKWGI